MSIAVAEAMLSGEEWTPQLLASKFLDAFKRDPREGYAGGFFAFLKEVKSGTEFLQKIRPDSDKSGAAMRACPLGVYADIEEVKAKAILQAKVTHDTPNGIAAAVAAALMPHYFLYDLGPKARLGEFLESHVAGQRWAETYRGKVKSKGWMSVRAAITAITRCDRLDNLLRTCIAFTGDVDTVATIALAAASCSREYDQSLPQSLTDGLENGRYGRDYLTGLDEKLNLLVLKTR